MSLHPNTFKAEKVSEHVYWVGAIDWDVRDFHGYLTQRGTTYNAYLVMADKITLIDTVKPAFKDEMLSRVASLIDPEKISYIISNHSEMDHSGSLPRVIDEVKPEKVFASPRGVKALSNHFRMDREIIAVKDGESMSLGGLSVSFVETPMIHWPDSMWTYLAGDEILFSNDGFGMHLASSRRFADEIDDDILEFEAAKYYANILMPFSGLVAKLLDKVKGLNLPIKTIAPDHGPIWRKEINRIIDSYTGWANRNPTRKAVVVFDSMWQSTAAMARAIGEGLGAGGADVRMMSLKACHRSDIAAEMLDSGALIVGSPTINSNMFPTVADILSYLKGLKPANLVGAVFGSFGWSGEAVKQIEEILTSMKVELVAETIKINYVPGEEDLADCRSLGIRVAEALREKCGVSQYFPPFS